jgi:hypothetical protein
VGKVQVTGYSNPVQSNVDSFIANLPEMLGAMVVDPHCLVAIAEFADARYVQFWVKRDGTVLSEVISNRYIGDAVALSEADEAALREQGWSEPSSETSPNWCFESNGADGLIRNVAMIRRAVFDVLGEQRSNPVSIRTWIVRNGADTSGESAREESRVRFQRALREIEDELDRD